MSCPGTDSTIISSRTCSIPVYVVRASPYNLPWGSSVFARMTATNAYGLSAMS